MHNRRHGRVRAKGVASHLRDGAQLITGLTVENLSRGGAFIRTPNPLAPGTAVRVDLVRPGLKHALQLSGKVVTAVTLHQSQAGHGLFGMGIQFDPYSEAVGQRLTDLLVALGAGPAVLEADPPMAGADLPVPVIDAAPPMPVEPAPAVVAVPEGAKLMVQVQGLMMELGDWQARVKDLERENAALKAEVARLLTLVAGES